MSSLVDLQESLIEKADLLKDIAPGMAFRIYITLACAFRGQGLHPLTMGMYDRGYQLGKYLEDTEMRGTFLRQQGLCFAATAQRRDAKLKFEQSWSLQDLDLTTRLLLQPLFKTFTMPT